VVPNQVALKEIPIEITQVLEGSIPRVRVPRFQIEPFLARVSMGETKETKRPAQMRIPITEH
jgi:hypothetical protein